MWLRRKEKKIGQILVDADIITDEELDKALKLQKENGLLLGKILIDLGYIDEGELTKFVAEQYRIPCVSLDRYEFRNDLLEVLPEDVSKAYGVIPLDVIGDILTVGISDVPDDRTFRRVEEITGYKVQVMLVTSTDFDDFMKKLESVSTDKKRFAERIKDGKYVRSPFPCGIERRRFERFEEALTIKYEFGEDYHIESTINISQGGVLIRSKCPIPVNSHIIVRLEIPTSQKELIVVSKVAWSKHVEKDNAYLLGLSFMSMDSSDSARLSKFIDSLSSGKGQHSPPV